MWLIAKLTEWWDQLVNIPPLNVLDEKVVAAIIIAVLIIVAAPFTWCKKIK